MKITVKCWKTKNNNVVKALCYVDAKGRQQVASFDKWFIGYLLGGMNHYYNMKIGDFYDIPLGFAEGFEEVPILDDGDLPFGAETLK